jgi:uncharacterized protein YqgC (DUF456 family)
MKYLSWLVIALWFVLGIYVFVSPAFKYLPSSARVVFGIFCLLFGFYRIARLYAKSREKDE